MGLCAIHTVHFLKLPKSDFNYSNGSWILGSQLKLISLSYCRSEKSAHKITTINFCIRNSLHISWSKPSCSLWNDIHCLGFYKNTQLFVLTTILYPVISVVPFVLDKAWLYSISSSFYCQDSIKVLSKIISP